MHPIGTPRKTRLSRQDGFTLVEILAVLAILALLMSLGFMSYGKHTERARVAETHSTIESLANLIAAYESKKGDVPPSELKALAIRAQNDTNQGIEACVAALHHKDHPTGRLLPDSSLGNTDQDQTNTVYHRNGSPMLPEAKDAWGNPIAYFSFHSYGTPQTYLLSLPEDREVPDQVVTAAHSEVTGTWANADSFQLISAGPDELYGTEDDVTNF